MNYIIYILNEFRPFFATTCSYHRTPIRTNVGRVFTEATDKKTNISASNGLTCL